MKVPKWICSKLRKSEKDVACMDVDSSKMRYNTLISFIGNYAVDIGETAVEITRTPKYDVRIPETVRQSPGKLSNLRLSASERETMFGKYYKDKIHFGEGSAYILVEGDFICFEHAKAGSPVGTMQSTAVHSTLRMFASGPDILRSFVSAVVAWKKRITEEEKVKIGDSTGKYRLYTLRVQQGYAGWESHGQQDSRSLNSIILPKEMLDSIVDDFKNFSSEATKKWYSEHGLPYRRGYLFHGEPGTGKTSTVRSLAGQLERSVCFLSLGDENIGNKELQDAVRTLPDDAMLVIEDVDALFDEKRNSKSGSELNFSGLLNAIDGLISGSGYLTIMTTNHPEKLDKALIRPGRVDVKFEFKKPTKELMKKLFLSFYPSSEEENNEGFAKQFADGVSQGYKDDAPSIATLQEHFIASRGKKSEECVAQLPAFLRNIKERE